jgi:hypothetical protein
MIQSAHHNWIQLGTKPSTHELLWDTSYLNHNIYVFSYPEFIIYHLCNLFPDLIECFSATS